MHLLLFCAPSKYTVLSCSHGGGSWAAHMNLNNMKSASEQTSSAATDGGPPVLVPQFPHSFPAGNVIGGDPWRALLEWRDRVFRRRDAIPVTFIDEDRLVEEVSWMFSTRKRLQISPSIARWRCSSWRLKRASSMAWRSSTFPVANKDWPWRLPWRPCSKPRGNAIALAGMPKDCSDCAYMPEPSNGEHYTLLPVSGDAAITHGPVGDFAAAQLTQRVHPPSS